MSSTTAAADKENMAMKPSMSPSLLAAAATEAPRQKKAGVGKASASSSASASSKTATGKAGGKDKDRGKDGAAAAATTTTTATATTATKEKTHKLSLKGSSKLVCEFVWGILNFLPSFLAFFLPCFPASPLRFHYGSTNAPAVRILRQHHPLPTWRLPPRRLLHRQKIRPQHARLLR